MVAYFDEMNLLQADKVYRSYISRQLENEIALRLLSFKDSKKDISTFRTGMLRLFALWCISSGMINKENSRDAEQYLLDRYGVSLKAKYIKSLLDLKHTKDYSVVPIQQICDQIDTSANEIVDATINHIEDDNYFSQKRAEIIALNETNRFSNLCNHEVAKALGYKYHIWHSMIDEKTRKTHFNCDLQKQLIDDPFVVGDFYMRFPMDTFYGAGPEEIINCRCTESYE